MKASFKDIWLEHSVFEPRKLPPPGLDEVAFLGRSNVGKSSLINAVLGRRRLARVSSTPGFTRAINFFRVDHRFYVVDLPGYGFAKVPPEVRRRWRLLIEGYLSSPRPLRLLVLIFDLRRDPDDLDRTLVSYVQGLGRRFIVVLNKMDRLKKTLWPGARAKWLRALALEEDGVILTSCREGWGVGEVRKRMLEEILRGGRSLPGGDADRS